MIDVTNRSYVDVRLIADVLLLGHWRVPCGTPPVKRSRRQRSIAEPAVGIGGGRRRAALRVPRGGRITAATAGRVTRAATAGDTDTFAG